VSLKWAHFERWLAFLAGVGPASIPRKMSRTERRRHRLRVECLEGRELLASTITGQVFQDFNANGTFDTTRTIANDSQGTVAVAIDQGMAGITVTAYDSSNAVAGTATTAANGTYTLTAAGAGPYRVQFTNIPAGYYQGPHGPNSGTTVQFLAGAGTASLGLVRPSQYAPDNPNLVTNTYWFGDQITGPNAAQPVIVSIPYSAGTQGADPTLADYRADLTGHVLAVPASQVGTTWGLAYSPFSQNVYAAAFMKKHAGFGPGGTGAIYKMGTTGTTASLYVDLNAIFGAGTAGANPHDTSGAASPNGYLLDNGNTTFNAVGKISLGGMSISDDGKDLYVMDLANRTLYDIPLTQAPTAANIRSVAVPLASIPNATGAGGSDIRPFAVQYYQGKIYVGLVNSAESTQSTTDLWAYVYTVDPATLAFSAAPAFQFRLNFARGQGFVGETPSNWLPWVPTWRMQTDAANPHHESYPQPMLTGITFDTAGNMVLGFRDRYGDQTGNYINDNPAAPTDFNYRAQAAGDALRAFINSPGNLASGWTLENNSQGPLAGEGPTGGLGDGKGPGGGRFYFQEDLAGNHDEVLTGGVLQLAGFPDVISTTSDPSRAVQDVRSGGLRWFNDTTGVLDKAYELYPGTPAGTDTTTFGKSNGVGDLIDIATAPIEIGNRVWRDNNGDGIQEAGEPALAGVTAHLYAPNGTLLATAVTDANGNYYFSSGPGTNTASAIYGVTGLTADTTGYFVRLDNAANYAAGGPLAGLIPTSPGAGTDPSIDSNGQVAGPTNTQAPLNTGDPGASDATIDFGFTPPGSVSGTVFVDLNNDGIQEAGESGIGNVTLTLTGTTLGGAAVSLTTTTAANGSYSFTGLLPSNAAGYTITQTLPVGYTNGLKAKNGVVIPGSNTTNAISGVVLVAGGTDPNNTFGEYGGTITKQLVDTSIDNGPGSSNDKTHAVIGELASYTVQITVPQGTTPTEHIVDTLPAGLAYVALVGAGITNSDPAHVTFTGSANPTVTSNGQTVDFNLGNVTNTNTNSTAVDTLTLAYQVVVLNVAGNVNGTTLTNSALMSWTGGGSATVSAPAVTVIEPKLQTSDAVAVGGGGGNPGDPVQYTITLQQNAASTTDAFNVTFADPLPKAGGGSSLILAPSFTVVDSAGTVTAANFQLVGSDAAGWTLQTTAGGAFGFPEAPAGRTITITLNGTLAGTVNAGQVVTNTANVQWTSLPGANPGQISTFNTNSFERTGNPSNPGGALNNYFNNASAAFTVHSADLQVTKTVNQPTPNVGDTITFTVTLKNNGPDKATNVKVSDALPAGLTLVSSTPSQGTYVGGTWTVGTVNNGASVTLVMTATVVSPNAQTNTASVSSVDEPDPTTADNSASATETPQQADLAVTKAVNNATPNVGDTITFTVTLSDNGPNSATNVQVTDLLPAGLTFVSATPSQGSYVSGSGLWTVGTVTTTTSQSLQILAKVVSPNAQTNTASVSHADQYDPNPANNSASATETPQQADLAVTKAVNNATPNVGDTITFTVTLSDNGPNSATNVQVTDLLPAGLTFVSATPSQGSYVSGSGLWTVGTVTTTTSQSLQILAKVVSSNAQTNTASISHADQFDPNSANNSASVTETPQQADLAVIKTVNNATPNVGDTITFTVTLSDNGPNSATNVQVTDLLPAGLSFVSATPSQGIYVSGTGVWTVGTVTTTTSQSLQFLANVVSPNAQTNTASVSHADQFDPNSANNSASVTETPQQADLAVTKTVNNATPNVGDTITFTVTLSDNGPNSATNVQVTDLLPAGLTFVSATPSQGSYVSGTGAWTVGTVTTTTSQSLQIQAKVVSPNAQTNTASVSHADQFDPNSANNSASVTETPQQADLAVTKSVNNAAPNVGDTITFTVTLTDNGPNSASNVQVSDALPAGLNFVSATPSQGTYNSGTGLWTVGSITTAAAQTLQILAKVVSPNAQTNTASVSHADQYDPNANNNSASVTETPQQADLGLTKTVNNTNPNVGDTITFTITLSDAGPNSATNVTVQDALPAGLTFVSATASQGSYNSGTGVWTVGTVTTAFARTLTLLAQVTSPNPVVNTATISHADQYDPNLSNNTASAPSSPQQADLAVVKTVNNATPNVGDTITFTITLSNSGPSAATNVQLQDMLPAGLTFVASTPSQGSYNNGTGIWTVGTVNNAASATLLLGATVVSPNAQTNTAAISHADQFDPNPGNNSSSAVETPQQADLALAKTVNNPTPNVGDTVTFTVTLNDNGPNTATNVQVSDLLPAGLSFVSATPSQGSYNNATGIWSVGSVTMAAAQTLQVLATVVSPNAQTNTATISHADQFDPNSGNNSASATETPQQADLALTKIVSNATPNVGDTITFTVTLTDQGPNTATNIVVHDPLPAGLVLVSASPSVGTYNSGTGDWSVATLGNGASGTLTISAKVVSPLAQTNSASITRADQYDPNPANNTASATETPQQADLAITKTVNNATPNVGDTITFTVTLADNGPNNASNVQVSDALPAGLSFVSANPSQGTYNNATGIWTVGAVSTATSQTLQILAQVVSPNAQTNTAAVSHADQYDPNSANNSASVTETPQQADLALAKTVNNATPNVGDTITFTVTLTDNGPNSASNVQVSDTLPAGLTFVSANPSQGTYNSGTGTWTVGSVTTATPQTLQILAKVTSPNAQTNTASLSHADQYDPNPNNNSASVTETPQQADLGLTKTVNNTNPNVGDTITFTITLSDAGPNSATNVTVQDALPAGLTFVSATPSQGSYNSGTGLWTVGSVDTAFARTLTLLAKVTSPNPVVNTATISHADQYDPNLSNNTASAPSSPQQADLAVVKTVNNATPNVGDTITFTITLSNSGPSAATNVQLQDMLPAGLTFVASTPSQGSYNNGTGIWTVGTVNNAASATLLLGATVVSPNAQTNTAAISHADQFDPNPGNNSSSAVETPQQADLALAKTVNNPTPNVGDTVTFTVTLNDNGPNTATNVQVSDVLPAGLNFVSATPSQGAYNSGTGVWTVGTVDTLSARTLKLAALVVSPGTLTNTASITHADQFDPNSSNNSASATINQQQADLAMSKIVSNSTPNVGDTITYTVTLSDLGPDAATNVVVHDPLPAGLVFVSAATSQGTYSTSTGDWALATLSNGAAATLSLSAQVVSPAVQVNTASITRSDQYDPNPNNNSASATETPQQADLAVTKSVNNAAPNVGDTITYTVQVSDLGPNAATNVQVNDLLPAGLSFVSANPSQGSYNNATGLWSVGPVSTTTPQTLQILAKVTSPNAQTNTASISHADQYDPDSGNNSASVIETPQQADLTISKTVNNATPNVGDTITYTITVADNGPNNASNVHVSDALPAGLSFVSANPSQGTYNSGTGIWTVGSVTTATPQTLQLLAQVVSPNAQTNTASISHADQFDPNSGNNSASVSETPQQADLALTKTVNNTNPNVGDTITFTITLSDNGPNSATNVTVQDALPAGLTFVSATASQGSYNSSTGQWTVGSVNTAFARTLTLRAQVTSPNPVVNTAAISHADQYDPNPNNNTASAPSSPQQADLVVVKTVNNPTPNVGDTITFTVTVSDSGPSNATNVTLQDLLPGGLSLVAANPSQGSYDGTFGTWTVGSINNGASATLTLSARVVSPNAQTNTASISHADQFDPNPGNNNSSATETPQKADLALQKSVNNPTPNVGDTVTFTVTLSDNGPNNASNVQVSDLLPAGLSFVSATASQGTYNNATGIWTVGSVSTATPQSLQILAQVTSPNAQTNTATISHADQFDPNPNNNSASATETPQQADLAVTKTVSNATPNVGDTITFTVTLSNAGPNTASNAVVHDPLPAGLALVSATPSLGTYNSGTGDWSVATLGNGASATLTISARVVSAAAQTNNASITHADQFDPNAANNSASATETPQQADLALTKTVNNATPNVGDTITFTVQLSDLGPNAASNVQVSDLLPAGLTFVSATPSQGSYANGTGLWTVGSVTTTTPQSLQILAKVVSANSQTNTAAISQADQFDPNSANNSASVTETPQQADLALTKSVSNATPNVGDTITFTVTLADNGPNNASNVQVSDLLPAGLSFVSATPSQGTYNNGTGLWTVGSVSTGTPQTLQILAQVTSPNAQTNTASISHADQFDPNANNNSATATETPQQADLGLTKTVNNTTPNVGDTITFTITLSDAGPNSASNVTVQDALPAGLTFVSATPSQGSYNSGTGLWTVGNVDTAFARTLTLLAKVTSPNPAVNTATISHADQYDPNPNNNTASAAASPQQADLVVVKSVDNATPNVGDTVTFTVKLSNTGPSNATNVTLQDLLPAGLSLVTATPSQGSYNSTFGTWTVGTVNNGASATLLLSAKVVNPNAQTNTASISHADQFDPNPGNNSSSATETPQQADLAISKTISNAAPNVGDTITYTIAVSDNGPNNASNVQVSDVLPAGLSFVSATPSQGTYNSATGLWTVGNVTTAAPQTLQILAQVVSPNAQTNTASISHADQFDPNSSNNSASVTEAPQQADLGVVKTVSNATPNVGDTISFTVTLSNAGPNTATNIVVHDLLPAGLALISTAPSSGTYNSGTGDWSVATLANSTTATLTIFAKVVSPAAQINSATITRADEYDPNPANNSASASETPQQADLAVSKTVNNATPNVGDTVTFTVQLSDLGPSTATNVQVSDLLPAGLSLVSATPSQGAYNSATGVWTVGTVSTTTPQSLQIQARVVSPNAQTNTASVSQADQYDPDSGNNSASVIETPQQADLAISKTVSNATPNVGDTITFTVTVADNGPNNASNVQVSDVLPAGLGFVSANPSQGTYKNSTGLWNVGSVSTTSPQTLQILAQVLGPNAQTNTATISHADQFDPNTGNNSAAVTETPQQADLGLTKTVNNTAPNVGDTITYTITLSDAGPNSASNVAVQDLLPAGLTFVSATPSQGTYNSGSGLWTVGAVDTLFARTLTLVAQVSSPNPAVNTATISHADQYDPNPNNNTASAPDNPQEADLVVVKTVNNPTPNVGDTITFTVTLSNIGPNNATNVSLHDLLPAGLTLVSSILSQGTYNSGNGSWTVGTVNNSANATLTLSARVVSPNAQTNTASISHADQFDPNPGNNSSSATETPQQADLALQKSVNNPTPNVGDTVTFTVSLSDNGPNNASNVQVSDLLPAGLTFISATPSQGTYNNATGIWTVGSVSTATPQSLQILAQVTSPNAQTNTAAVSHADQFDPNPNNNTASVSETPQQADLAVTKIVSNANPNVGDTITFTVTLSDQGPNAASNVVVHDPLPAGLALLSAVPSLGTYNSGTGDWSVATLSNGATATLTISARVVSAAAQTNTATITRADQFDPNPANNSASAGETPQQADLAITKTVNNATPNVGDTITFTVQVSDLGPDAATNVQVSDLLPAGLSLVSSTPSQGSYNGGTGIWTVGTVTTTTTQSLQVVARVVSPASQNNTASVSHADQFDPNSVNNSASAVETPQQADLAVTKSVNNLMPNVGDTITFTVTVTDNGPNAAGNVQVSDALPAGLSFVSATPSQGAYNSGTGLWTVGAVTTATPQTLQILAKVVSPNPQTNTAALTHADQFDPNASNNSASATETPQQADLVLTKTVNNPTPNVGDTITFTISLSDAGPNSASNVTVLDALPAGLTFVSAAASQGSYNSGTGVWTVGSVDTAFARTLTLLARVATPNPAVNTATISHADQYDPNLSNNTASAPASPQQADLVVVKTVDNASPNVGDTITFTVRVNNTGPSNATNVTLQDLLPAGLTLVAASPSQGSYNSSFGGWTVGTINNGASVTLTLSARVVSPNAQTNTAAVSHADQFDPNPGNNSSSATETPQQADLVVTKTVSNAAPNVGDTITYTITLRDNGPNSASNVQVSDALPAGLSFVSAAPSQGTYNNATGLWTVGSVTTATSQTLQILAKVVSSNAQTNTAAISHADQFDPNSSNNSASVTETPQQADLAVTKSVNNSAPNVGDTITFTVTLSDQGPNTATNVVVHDPMPAGLALVSAAPSLGTYNSGTGDWSVATLGNGASATLTISARVVSPAAQTNSAAITRADQFDPNPGNNTASATETPQQADVVVTKTANNSTPNVGDTLTFTVQVSDLGPSTATNVQVSDLLPTGLSLVSASPSQGTYNSGTGIWTVGTVSTTASQTLQIQARAVSANAQTNTASVSQADQYDPNPGNNSASVTETPQQADLAISKTVSNASPNVGDTVTFTVTVADNGPSNASNVQVSDVLPAGLSFVSANPSQGTYSNTTGLWNVGSVSTTTPQTLQILAKVISPNGQTNTASLSHADQFDPNSGNNSASATETPQQADLVITKTVDNPTPNVGATVTYTITLSDAGPNTATDAVVQDTLPAGLTFVSATPSQGTYDNVSGLWTVGTVTTAQAQTLQIVAMVSAPVTVVNTATINHADQYDPNPNNNTASAPTSSQQADLFVIKSVDNPAPNVGDTVTFTVKLGNTGPSTATNVQLQDVLPAGLTFVSSNPSQGSYNSTTGIWTVGALNNGASATLTLSARVTSPNAQTNTATVSHEDQFDPNPGNDSSSATETPQQADLALTKTVSNASPNVGDAITYTITLNDNGPNNASNVQVTDLLPAGLSFVSASTSQGTYNNATGLWTVGVVSTTTPQTLQILARVISPNAQTNTASVSHSDQFDPNPANSSASVTETPQQADLVVTKTVDNATPNVGAVITFTVTLSNQGPNAATNVVVHDPLPAGLAFISAAPTLGTYNSGTGDWSIVTLANGASALLRIAARVVSPAAQTNTAGVSNADQFDPNPNNSSSSVTETPQQADLAATKVVSNATPHVGDTVTFTVTVNNLGPNAATDVTANDSLPGGLIFVSSAPSAGTYNNVTGVWFIGTLANQGSATLQIQARVAGTGSKTNNVQTSADQFDPNLSNNQASVAVTPLSSLSGFVYFDANNDGLRESGEPGVGNVTLTLSGSNDLGQNVSLTTTTAASGAYSFPNLRPGTYTITETPPPQFNNGKTSAGSLGGTAGANTIGSINLGAGFDGIDYNFGELGATISGEVFVDANRNGVLDPGETGLGGVRITLEDPNGNVLGTTASAANGTYSFANLLTGRYELVETPASGYGSSTPTTLNVSLAVTGSPNQNFGLTTAAISGNVFVDPDNNGIKEPGEPGIAGVVLTVTGTDVNGNRITQTVTTAADGSYHFSGLLAGAYTLNEGPTSGYQEGINSVGTVNGRPDGALGPGVDVISAISLGGGSVGSNYNFAEVPPPATALTGIETAIVVPGVPYPVVSVSDLGKYLLLGSSAASVNANILYVNGLYHELLQRAPEQAAVDTWVYDLQTGALSRLVAAAIIDRSAEHRGLQVDRFYEHFLHRPAEAAGRAGWVNYILAGGSESALAIAFLTSPEYLALHQGNAAFVTSLYADVLGRLPDAPGLAGWVARLQAGASDAAVANCLLTSTEAYNRIVDQSYLEYLRRPADAGGEAYYTGLLQSGQWAPESIAELLLASDEFYGNPR